MSTEQTTDGPETPVCTACEREMDLVAEGEHRAIPIVGSTVEYVRYTCSDCGQGARFERSPGESEWRRPGVPSIEK